MEVRRQAWESGGGADSRSSPAGTPSSSLDGGPAADHPRAVGSWRAGEVILGGQSHGTEGRRDPRDAAHQVAHQEVLGVLGGPPRMLSAIIAAGGGLVPGFPVMHSSCYQGL